MPMRITGMNSGLDTEAMVQELVSAYKKKGEKTTKEKTKLEWKQDIWKDLNKKIKSFNKKVQNLKYSSSYNLKKTTSSNESKATVIAGENAVKGTQTLKVTELAQAKYITSGKLEATQAMRDAGKTKVTGSTTLGELGLANDNGTIEIRHNNGDSAGPFDVRSDMTIDELITQFKTSGVEASFDEANGRIFVSAKQTGESNGFEFIESGGNDVIGLLKLDERDASIKEAKDAKIILNDAEFTSSTNNFDINGLSISVKDKTADDETIILSTDTDTEGVYNQIKGLIKEYSSLINELDKLYNAELAKDYEPLTDDEKDALSDKEIEKWETKIKDSLLRRDSNVSAVSSAMRQAALQSYNVNGKEMTLADFGIGTLGYFASADNEKNALHIDGDEDDDDVASNANKLKKMIADDPEAVSGFFSSFLQNLSDRLSKLSASTDNRSYGNFYDDKKFDSDIKNYTNKVADWEAYVKKVEDKYYKQFSKMETQLAKLNSTQQSFASYFPS